MAIKGCYVSYSGSTCLPGFTNKGSLGQYGGCYATYHGEVNASYGHILSPPGALCGDPFSLTEVSTKRVVFGTAYLCCQ